MWKFYAAVSAAMFVCDLLMIISTDDILVNGFATALSLLFGIQARHEREFDELLRKERK